MTDQPDRLLDAVLDETTQAAMQQPDGNVAGLVAIGADSIRAVLMEIQTLVASDPDQAEYARLLGTADRAVRELRLFASKHRR